MKKINEIFYSIQGEGFFTGTPAVFIRFSGCNLSCPFCDTGHESGILMTDEKIIAEISKYPASHIILTGGEPGLQIDAKLVDTIKAQGKFIQIETNGTCLLPDNIDWITCSPKEGGIAKQQRIDELKIVYTGQDLSQYDSINAKEFYLQPCSGTNTGEVIACIMNNPKWKLSLQTHKILNIP